MEQTQKGFTILEVVLVVAVLVLLGIVIGLSGVLSPSGAKAHNEQQINQMSDGRAGNAQQTLPKGKQQLIQCTNNLRQISIGLLQYEMMYNAAPVYNTASATTTTDGKLCAANLMRLNVCGLVDDLQEFRCPFGAFSPAKKDADADR